MNTKSTKAILASLAVVVATFLLFDGIWLGLILKKRWAQQIATIQNGEAAKLRYLPAALVYLLMVIAVMVLVVYPNGSSFSQKENKNYWIGKTVLMGSVLGAAMFGCFDGTNLVMFKKYQWSTAAIDFFYGIAVTLCASLAGTAVFNKLYSSSF